MLSSSSGQKVKHVIRSKVSRVLLCFRIVKYTLLRAAVLEDCIATKDVCWVPISADRVHLNIQVTHNTSTLSHSYGENMSFSLAG